ncbi:DNA repair protein RAD5A [Vitis vinifera]|uniref:DNA repair protein RAD5A n=1 Tax=Vitis vinifera TaxID=29760 RepID=A0A438C9M4_VITVI|nr:DNA repair protein RAD5A [Vitis vinifera]
MERILYHSPTAKPVDLNMKHGSGCFIGFIGLCSVLFCHSPVLGNTTAVVDLDQFVTKDIIPINEKEVVLPLTQEFPNFYNKEDLALPSELEPFSEKASFMTAIDYVVYEKNAIAPCRECTLAAVFTELLQRISGLADTICGAKEAQRSNSREFRLRRRPLKKSNDHLAPHARLENRNWVESSKVAALLLELENLCSVGSKSILFSQWTAFLDLLQIPLSRSNISFVRLDGTLNQQQREKVIKQFSEESHILVLLMSLKAGGVGINLMAASHAFVLDPWWNPAVEEQAVMRIHRIGQTKRVMIKRFIAKGTIQRSALIASKMQSRAT